jgi:hypothetical protein
MTNWRHNIFKQISLLGLSAQLVITLSGFNSNINPSDCCHKIKIVKKAHSCCQESFKETSSDCMANQSFTGHTLSNCGCIHSISGSQTESTVQNSFELQKENSVALVYINIDNQNNTYLNYFKQRIEKEESPPFFLLDSILLI